MLLMEVGFLRQLLKYFLSFSYYFSFLPFFAYHSLNDSFGPSGISRCLYQGLNLLFIIKGTFCINHRPAFPAVVKFPGDDNVHAIAFILNAFVLAAYPSFTITCRHSYNCSCILIFTGQTLEQEPQSVEAKGRSA